MFPSLWYHDLYHSCFVALRSEMLTKTIFTILNVIPSIPHTHHVLVAPTQWLFAPLLFAMDTILNFIHLRNHNNPWRGTCFFWNFFHSEMTQTLEEKRGSIGVWVVVGVGVWVVVGVGVLGWCGGHLYKGRRIHRITTRKHERGRTTFHGAPAADGVNVKRQHPVRMVGAGTRKRRSGPGFYTYEFGGNKKEVTDVHTLA